MASRSAHEAFRAFLSRRVARQIDTAELDAQERSLASGQLVVVRSRTGEVRATVEATEDIVRGVVGLPHG